jgi:cytoskeletal protein RodZ
MDVGGELRGARERAGLSREDVAQKTKIQLAKIEALETNAFERLPDGIYLDGLIRAYADEVGLDGRELVMRFHRDYIIPLDATTADEFPTEADAASAGLDVDRDRVEPPADTLTGPATSMPSASMPSASMPSASIPPPAMRPPALPTADLTYSAPPLQPFPMAAQSEPARPPSRTTSRFVLPMLAVLAAIGVGAYLYDENRSFPEREEIAVPAVSQENAQAAQATPPPAIAPGATQPDALPAAANATPASRSPRARATPTATPAANAAAASDKGASPPDTASATGTEAPSSAPTAAPGEAPAAKADTSNTASSGMASNSSVPSLAGFWTLDTRVESSSLREFEGLQLGYRLELLQDGARITGHGVKTTENGDAIGSTAQTPITIAGTLDGRRLTLTFTERGTERESHGKMILDVYEDGVLRGRFSSNAAQSSGTAEARRPEG